MLTLVEMYVGIMTACMPVMNMFLKWIRGEKSVPAEPENDTIGGGGWRKGRNRGVQESQDSGGLGPMVGESGVQETEVGLELKMETERENPSDGGSESRSENGSESGKIA